MTSREHRPEAAATAAPDGARSFGALPAWLPGVGLLVVLTLRHLQQEFWLDEAFSQAATHHLPETLERTSGTMALYYTLLTPWSWISESVVWLRVPSLVAMCGALVCLCLFVERAAGRAPALAAGIVAAALPSSAFYAAEARSYALVCLLSALGWYSALREIEQPGRWRWVSAGCIVLLPLAHGLGVIQGLALVSTVLAATGSVTHHRLLVGAGLVSVAIVGVLLLCGAGEVGDWVAPNSVAMTERFLLGLTHEVRAVGVLFGLVILAGACSWWRSTPAAGAWAVRFGRLSLLVWGPGTLVAIFLLSTARPSLLSRYALAASLALAALLAHRLVTLRSERMRRLALPLLLALALPLQVRSLPGQPWRAVADRLATEARPGDQVVFGTADARLPFESAWQQGDPRPRLTVPGPASGLGSFDRFGGLGDAEVVLAEVDASRTIWLVDQRYEHAESRTEELHRVLTDQLGFRLTSTVEEEGQIELRRYEPA